MQLPINRSTWSSMSFWKVLSFSTRMMQMAVVRNWLRSSISSGTKIPVKTLKSLKSIQIKKKKKEDCTSRSVAIHHLSVGAEKSQ